MAEGMVKGRGEVCEGDLQMSRTSKRLCAVGAAAALIASLASCSDAKGEVSESPDPSDQPVAVPEPPYALACGVGVSGVSTDYDHFDEATLFDTPEGVADRVVAAHPSWRVTSSALTKQSVDVAVYDPAGVIQGVLRAQSREGYWILSADRTCDGTSLYK